MLKFYVCKETGTVIERVIGSCDDFKCCGKDLVELKAGTTDAALEKHVPAVEVNGSTVTVKVGEVAHPMLEEHYINCVYLETKKGVQRVDLKPGEEPVAVFAVAEGDAPVAAYEYCNLHGLWKKEI